MRPFLSPLLLPLLFFLLLFPLSSAQDFFKFTYNTNVNENERPSVDQSVSGGVPGSLQQINGDFTKQHTAADFAKPLTYEKYLTCADVGCRSLGLLLTKFSVQNTQPSPPDFMTFVMMEGTLDRELVKDPIRLEIKASYQFINQAEQTVNKTLVLTVNDANDNSPICDSNCVSHSTATIPETNNMGVIRNLKAAMTDEDALAFGTVSYTLTSVTGVKNGASTAIPSLNFFIDESTGIVENRVPLDYEATDEIVIEVVGTDNNPFNGGIRNTKPLTLRLTLTDVDDNLPVFSGPTNPQVSVSENASVGFVVYELSATDADEGDNARVEFVLTENEYFKIETARKRKRRKRAVETKAKIVVKKQLDFETAPSVPLSVTAHNPAPGSPSSPPLTFNVSVTNVNDEPPRLEGVDNIVIPDAAVRGDTIAAVKVNDPDGGDPFDISLVPDPSIDGVFALQDGNTADEKKLVMQAAEVPTLASPANLKFRACDTQGNCQDQTSKVSNENSGVKIGALSLGPFLAILFCLLILLLLLLLLLLCCRRRRRKNKEKQLVEDDVAYEENYCYVEEGAEELDNDNYDISQLRKPTEPSLVLKDPALYGVPINAAQLQGKAPEPRYVMQQPPQQPPEDVDSFIHRRMREADDDPTSPPFDTIMEFRDEGAGSLAGSLSSISSCARDADQNFDDLRHWGPHFSKLADMYGGGEDSDEDDDSSRHQAATEANSVSDSDKRSLPSVASPTRREGPGGGDFFYYA